LVLGHDDALPALSQIPVIPLSTQQRGLRWEVPLSVDDGVPNACVLKPEWIRAVDRTELAVDCLLSGRPLARDPDRAP
jgi:mRNA-degrading endonuclease toxin of MazEF toxin-antitoxin module